ncbi:MAG: hypothetical protein M3Q49_08820 [Actinomycetota bacterium]|nr:hypothetical protein [Actinomycetota bacterium]
MPESDRVREVRRRAIVFVGASREGVAALSNSVGSIWADVYLSQQGREEHAARAVREARPEILRPHADAREEVEVGLRDVEQALGRLTDVSPEEMSARALTLGPVLSTALENREGMMNAYRRRFDDLASRRLLEETAESVIDALGGSDGGQFAQNWRFLRDELAAGRPAEELRAEADRDALGDLASYLGSAERVVNFELNALDPEVEVSSTAGIGVQRDVAAVNRYESEHSTTTANL